LVDTRHEAAAAHAAEGWALATGEPGVCAVTAGPGLTNAITGIANAYADGSPLVCFAGTATLRGQDAGEVEGLEQLEIARPVTKWARRIHHLDRIPEYVATAFRHATTGRPGPVYLEFAIDLIHSKIDESEVTFPPSMWREQRRLAPPADLVSRAAKLISKAQRPAVVAGSGVWWSGAHDELRALVEKGIPVVTRMQGRGTIPDDHPLCFGNDWQNVCHQADALLIVGTQLNYFFGYGRFPQLEHLIQIDINPEELGRNRIPVDVAIMGDAKAALSGLAEEIPPLATQGWVSRLRAQRDEIEANKAALARSDATPIHPLRLCAELSSILDPDATIVCDGSNNLIWTGVAFKALKPGRIPSMGTLGNLGHGVSYCIAAGLARPDTQLAWVVGDGSFGFNAMELDTAARFGIPVVAVIMNNLGWSAQWIPLGLRHYELMAPAFEGEGALVERPDQIKPALERAFASGKPSILNVLVDPAPEYFPGRVFASASDASA
jgi:thiamine pyrophosphate-dependent acetolactate synthase large subunit-like protein